MRAPPLPDFLPSCCPFPVSLSVGSDVCTYVMIHCLVCCHVVSVLCSLDSSFFFECSSCVEVFEVCLFELWFEMIKML